MTDSVCYLDGEFLPLSQARVHVLDRGFIFGDGVYEVVPVFNGVAFRLDEHLGRLGDSLAAVRMTPPLGGDEWHAIFERLIADNGGGEQSVYLQITRGVAPRNHVLQSAVSPTVFAMVSALEHTEPVGLTAITVPDIRWRRCDIKATSLLANVMARSEAAAAGADEAIFLRDGYVTEGAASNIFVVSGGSAKTPPLSRDILPGVTRNLLCELMVTTTSSIVEAAITEYELRTADEIWATSSSRELVPVTVVDGEPVGNGVIGPCFRAVREVYLAFKRNYCGER